jgi:steroid delta-isomerase-like uncharacterized protein
MQKAGQVTTTGSKTMLRTFLILITCFVGFSPCHASESENISVATAMIEAINRRDLDALDDLVAPDVVRRSAATAGVTVESLDDFKAFLKSDFSAVPDSVMNIDLIFGNDRFVAIRAIYSGTQKGRMGPFPPSGKHFELPFIGILKLEGGKISELWIEWDNVYALSQLGHFGQSGETQP